jgi:hypothetical protein
MEHRDVYNEMLEKIKNEQNFSFARWGDGEWAIILKNEIYKQLSKN